MFTKDDLQDLTIEELLQMNETIVNLIKEKRNNKKADANIIVGSIVDVETGKPVAGFPCIERFKVIEIKRTRAVCESIGSEKQYSIKLTNMELVS